MLLFLQDNIHKEYKDTGALWSMCWMNFWCSLYNSVYLFGFTRAGWDLLAFCAQHPEVRPTTCKMLQVYSTPQPLLECSACSPGVTAEALPCMHQIMAYLDERPL